MDTVKKNRRKNTDKQVATFLPIEFHEKWKRFVRMTKQNDESVANYTEREMIFHALGEYMENHPVN